MVWELNLRKVVKKKRVSLACFKSPYPWKILDAHKVENVADYEETDFRVAEKW